MSRPSVGEDPKFEKSTFSGADNCLEVALVDGWVLLRNSRRPQTEIVRLTPDEWAAFRLGVQNGEFHFD